ncbi:metallophosphoesterase [Georgenia wangjunii]|uniref:metallophosphoesterase n=1 Tax=Georgenia wangjunii TaxID=3117730 RepID=UPI002F269028
MMVTKYRSARVGTRSTAVVAGFSLALGAALAVPAHAAPVAVSATQGAAEAPEGLPADIAPPAPRPAPFITHAGEHDHDEGHEHDDDTAAAAGAQARAAALPADADRQSYLGKTHYRAEVHSHTAVSDGQALPIDAMEHVEENGNVDFFAVTDHDVVFDLRNADHFTQDWRESLSEEWRYSHQTAEDFNAAGNDLVALIGEEVTWYDGTGHMNLFNADWFLTAQSDGGGTWGTGNIMYDMPTVLARLTLDPEAIGQFNHPASSHGHFGFAHLTPEADAQVPLFEYKSTGYHDTFVGALDAGWHLAPVWSGDEHQQTWVTGNPAHTGVWATERSTDGLYDAMRDRSMYTTFDLNASLQLGANGEQMGAILPASTTELTLDVVLADPDDGDAFASAVVYTNGGAVAHEFTGVGGTDVALSTTLDVADGQYYWLKATQADGDELVSAPVWVGERVAGANYAPALTVGKAPATAAYGQRIELPTVDATDDGGTEPAVDVTVYNGGGEVLVTDGAFTVSSYADHFVVTRATDAVGSTAAHMQRIVVSQDHLDPEGVFQYFGSAATVGPEGGTGGLATITDPEIEDAWVQLLPAGSGDWSQAVTVAATADQVFEVDMVATEAETYQDSITGQTLRSHEFDLTGLEDGQRYAYRFGVGTDGGWTDVRGEFVAGGTDNAPIYVLGDLQVSSQEEADHALFTEMLAEVRAQRPGGNLLVQVGDLVDNGGRGQYWDQAFDWVLDDLDLQLATMVGNHETYGDKEFNHISPERNAIFRGMFNHPKNGSEVGESNYSFDRGDIHVAVLNSNYDLQTQIDWLVEDMRATDKRWKVVTGHFSYYGGSHADDAGMSNDRALVAQTLDQLGVDLYIGGHDHVYKRSVIHDDALAATPEEEAAGTTYVTMGSSGPKFYENQEFWWDDVVYDENKQVGAVLEVTDAGLTMTAYTVDGEVIDEFTVTQPEGTWELSSATITDRTLPGVGFLSYPGARESLTVIAAAYDYAGEEVVDLRVEDVTLDHRGGEQFVVFDEPMPIDSSHGLRVFVWDSLGNGVPLRDPLELRRAMLGEGSAESPYEVRTWQDVENIVWEPAAHYVLMNDLDLDGAQRPQIGAGTEPFRGVFDGQGHAVTGYRAPESGGAGLFATNAGTIRDLAVTGADIDSAQGTIGILADYSTGVIEGSWTSGSITGASRVGGVVGDSTGVVRDSYSTADVRSRATEAGGVVGVALAGSTTQRVYSTGNVTADTRNVGGVVGYGYTGTTVDHVVSLNESVTAPSYAHAVVGRVGSGQRADLAGNLATDAAFVSVESLADAPAEDNLKGRVVPAADTRSEALYAGALGWDLTGTWVWDTEAQRPLLRGNTEDYVEERPAGEPNADGFYEIADVAGLAQVTAFPGEKFVLTADLDLSGVSDFEPLGGFRPFTGELDGNGHVIAGLTSARGGLVNINNGTIRDLGLTGADVTLDGGRVGILANVSNGHVENVFTTGTVSGGSRVGGVVGDSGGTVRNVYSTADVHTRATEAGGVIGVALAGSVSENLYATGAVSADARNIGGVVGYAYTGTQISDVIALNPGVSAPSYAHRVLGRVLSGNTATLANLWAAESVVADVVSNLEPPSTTSWMGATASARQTRDPQFYTRTLGWDLESVWTWHEDAGRPVLRAVTEVDTGEPVPPLPPEEAGPALERDTDGAYLIEVPGDLAEVTAFPGADFRLAASLDLTGVEQPQLAPDGFTGTFDGAGRTIGGYASTSGGLFVNNVGTITRVGLADAHVTTTASNVGLLVDANNGLVDEVWTSGSITGTATVGGVVGYLYGTLRDSYSTADVTADGGRQAGGVVGITGRGSLTERVYATGAVESVANQNAGGITGYAYTGTTVRDSFALNASVTASSQASRVVARVLAGDTATMTNNYASAALVVGVETVTAEGPGTQRGETRTAAEVADVATWRDGLGWDFDAVWQWDPAAGRPVLQDARESAGN